MPMRSRWLRFFVAARERICSFASGLSSSQQVTESARYQEYTIALTDPVPLLLTAVERTYSRTGQRPAYILVGPATWLRLREYARSTCRVAGLGVDATSSMALSAVCGAVTVLCVSDTAYDGEPRVLLSPEREALCPEFWERAGHLYSSANASRATGSERSASERSASERSEEITWGY